MALLRSGERAAARKSIERAIAIEPGLAEALYNLGNALFEDGELANSAVFLRRAAELDPANGHFQAAYGQTLHKLGQYRDAVAALRHAVEQFPADVLLRCDMGDALLAGGATGQAIAEFERAEALDPRLARAPYSRGCAESARRNHAAAEHCFERAVALSPDWAEAQHNLGQALFNLGEVDAALAWFRQAAAKQTEAANAMIAVVIPGSPRSSNQDVLEARRAFAARSLPHRRDEARFSGRRRASRLRVGYVSSFFHRANWMKPVWGLINQHDRVRFEIHLFSDAPLSAIEGGYRPHPADVFHDITGLPNEDAADRIEAAEIDLLIDLNGYSAVQRLPLIALHPAPVVCGWFNLFATTGIAAYDYLIGDRVVIPKAEEASYTERIAVIPGSYLTFDVSYDTPPVRTLTDLPGVPFRFGCLAPLYKITPECLDAWASILQATCAAVLTLKNRAFEWPEAAGRVRDAFARRGVAPDRLRLLGPSPHYQFLETYSEIDLALDTFPYNGGTTTTEALWQGVPVLTFGGDRWVSRTSASLLKAAGLSEYVAPDCAGYIARAIEIANSPVKPEQLAARRSAMRSTLQNSSVCGNTIFARRMERLYSVLARKY